MILQLQLDGCDLHKIIHSGVGHSVCKCPLLVNYFYKKACITFYKRNGTNELVQVQVIIGSKSK